MATQSQILRAMWLFWEDKGPLSLPSIVFGRKVNEQGWSSRPGDAFWASDSGMQHFQPKVKQLPQCTSVPKIKTIISQI